MRIDTKLMLRLRQDRSWTQDELAIAAGLNLRTIQRIEKEATASLQSRKAIASAFDIDVQDLDPARNIMRTCPECGSEEIYQYKELITSDLGYTPFMAPKLGKNAFSGAMIRPVICAECGNIRYFVDENAREKLKQSRHWLSV